MKKLPIDREERIKVFSEKIAQHAHDLIFVRQTLNQQNSDNISITSFSDIELLSNERRIYFIVETPTFQYGYIEDGQEKFKNMSVKTFMFNDEFFKAIQREYQNGKLFAFYSLRENKIRGTFIDKTSDYIIEDRDKRIDELLS